LKTNKILKDYNILIILIKSIVVLILVLVKTFIISEIVLTVNFRLEFVYKTNTDIKSNIDIKLEIK
jgi:hypothetical protein